MITSATAVLERQQQHWPFPNRDGSITFANIDELVAFLQHEIFASKLKFGELAKRAGCHPTTVANMARGDTHYPRAGTVFALLGALGFEIDVRKPRALQVHQ